MPVVNMVQRARQEPMVPAEEATAMLPNLGIPRHLWQTDLLCAPKTSPSPQTWWAVSSAVAEAKSLKSDGCRVRRYRLLKLHTMRQASACSPLLEHPRPTKKPSSFCTTSWRVKRRDVLGRTNKHLKQSDLSNNELYTPQLEVDTMPNITHAIPIDPAFPISLSALACNPANAKLSSPSAPVLKPSPCLLSRHPNRFICFMHVYLHNTNLLEYLHDA